MQTCKRCGGNTPPINKGFHIGATASKDSIHCQSYKHGLTNKRIGAISKKANEEAYGRNFQKKRKPKKSKRKPRVVKNYEKLQKAQESAKQLNLKFTKNA